MVLSISVHMSVQLFVHKNMHKDAVTVSI